MVKPCVNFAQQYGLPIKIARPFNNYGPGFKITDGQPCLTLHGICLRDKILRMVNTHVLLLSDAIIGYFKVLFWVLREPYNIGNEKPEISILDWRKSVLRSDGRFCLMMVTRIPESPDALI